MTENYTKERTAAVDLLRRGEATLSEVAELAGVGRQLSFYWAKADGIDVAAARKARLKMLWRKATA